MTRFRTPDPCEQGWVKQDGRHRPILSNETTGRVSAPEGVHVRRIICHVPTCVNVKQMNFV